MSTSSFLPAQYAHPYEIDPKYSKSVAYFCMEYAIDNVFKIYSGGLGYLAGSHMRSAGSLKQNLVGVGILWSYGYYNQIRAEDGSMAVQYRRKEYSFLEDHNIKFLIHICNAPVWVKAYYLRPETFGTAPMFFLSTDVPENDAISRSITQRLYDSNPMTRISQYIVLGQGGARLFEELGVEPEIYHMNEAHAIGAAFNMLARNGGNVDEVRKRFVFTTHTPEEAGNEKMDINLMANFSFFDGLSLEQVRAMLKLDPHEQTFNYTLAALRLSHMANGVSELHGEVSRQMWQGYSDICPITHVTNAQNLGYWQDPELAEAFEARDKRAFKNRKRALKKELFRVVGEQTGHLFDQDTLTIVWARRFAAYKRPALITENPVMFERMLQRTNRPVQMIWAGKPYPTDFAAVDIFNKLNKLSEHYPRCAVLTGYELGLSRLLKNGSDIWLNNPVVTREASGTSGMSAAMNGSLTVSTNDGWVREFARDGQNCFMIPEAKHGLTPEARDRSDRDNFYNILESKILPLYYDNEDAWLDCVFNAMSDISPAFNSDRMADEYYTKMYNN
ncbi:MAG: alpha-glucan family phosphorylase [Akkermansiaceae bacterium]|nr:alpha-glucan family phosphorylase [Akkermansiaceae bacterium]